MVEIELVGGDTVSVTQVAGCIARRIICETAEGRTVLQGDIYGMITLGSSCIIEFPERFRPIVKKGGRVYAGISDIAVLADE